MQKMRIKGVTRKNIYTAGLLQPPAHPIYGNNNIARSKIEKQINSSENSHFLNIIN